MTYLYRTSAAVAAAAVLAFLFCATSSAVDKTADKATADKPAPGADVGMVYEGRIDKVSADDNQLTLSGVRVSPTPTDKATVSDKDKVAPDKDKAAPDKGASMTFTVAKDAKITLDGDKAKLSDLKSGLFARVHVSSDAIDKGDKDKAARLTADRIDASTKEKPKEKATDKPKDKATDKSSDKDR